MADAVVRAAVRRWVSSDQPGWIEVGLVDSAGVQHLIVEKIPVLTDVDIKADALPTEIWLRCETGDVESGHVDVTLAHGVETAGGRSTFSVPTDDVSWL